MPNFIKLTGFNSIHPFDDTIEIDANQIQSPSPANTAGDNHDYTSIVMENGATYSVKEGQ